MYLLTILFILFEYVPQHVGQPDVSDVTLYFFLNVF